MTHMVVWLACLIFLIYLCIYFFYFFYYCYQSLLFIHLLYLFIYFHLIIINHIYLFSYLLFIIYLVIYYYFIIFLIFFIHLFDLIIRFFFREIYQRVRKVDSCKTLRRKETLLDVIEDHQKVKIGVKKFLKNVSLWWYAQIYFFLNSKMDFFLEGETMNLEKEEVLHAWDGC